MSARQESEAAAPVRQYAIGIDVSTGSVWAGVFDDSGRMLASAKTDIWLHREAGLVGAKIPVRKESGGGRRRYCSGFPENLGEKFDAPFARLDWISPDRLDIQWHRHTGESFRRHNGPILVNAIEMLSSEGLLHPA